MNKYSKLKTINVFLAIIAIISVIFNIYFIATRTKPFKQDDAIKQTENNNKTAIEEKADNKQQEDNKVEEVRADKEKESKVEYVYIEGEEKEVIVEKEVEKTIEVPALSTDATITYVDANGNTKTIELPSGTTINFSAGEHGTYSTIPSSITLSNNQQLDITDSSYNPSSVEVNYIFKGFSYSGNTMKCEYSLANNTVNVDCKQIAKPIKKGDTLYIQLDYLESSGTQYINTGVNIPDDCVMDIDMQFTASNITNLIGTVGPGTANYRADFGILNGKWFCYMGNDYFGNTENANTNRHQFKMDYNNKVFSIDGTTKKSFSSVYGTRDPYLLFARRDTSSINPYAQCKIYNWKITQNGVTKFDLIPVERANDSKLGMLDRQNGTFYTNDGLGEFAHPNIELFPGINVGKVMASGSYESGSSLTLTAIPNDDYIFVKWFDGNTSPTRTITVGSSTVYTALFIEK